MCGNDFVIAVIIILLILLVWSQMKKPVSERMEVNQIYTAGANQRRLAQEFSSTDQGDTTTVYNPQLQTISQAAAGPDFGRRQY